MPDRSPLPETPRPLTPDEGTRLDRLRTVARVMDTAIGVPGTRFRIGLDPLIGLVPGVGDTVGAAVSAWTIVEAARLGAPKPLLLRMAANVGVEMLVGTIPLLGDLFDAGWKANTRNLRLLELQVDRPVAARRAGTGFVIGLVVVLALLLAGLVWLGILAGRWLASLF